MLEPVSVKMQAPFFSHAISVNFLKEAKFLGYIAIRVTKVTYQKVYETKEYLVLTEIWYLCNQMKK